MTTKYTDDVLDYSLAFDLASGEAIASATWTVARTTEGAATGSDLAIGTGARAPSFSGSTATVWLSGGRVGESWTVSAVVVTDASPARTLAGSMLITIAAL
jgi:hypothetical protein